MSSILSKAKEFILGPEFDDEDYFEEYEEVFETEPNYTPIKQNKNNSNSKVVSLHQVPKMEVVRTYPEVVADAFSVCDYIRENKVCIVNLEGVDDKESQRIADFLGGVAYAVGGDIQRISNGVFIIAPTSVEITGDLKNELKETGALFPWLSSALK